MLRLRIATAAPLVALLALAGCGGSRKLAEVQGTVKDKKGMPLDKIMVEFWPEGQGQRSSAVTDKDGKYTLMTDDGKHKGAVVGRHRVVLRDSGILGDKFLGRGGEDVDMAKGKKPRIAAKFGDSKSTTIIKDVASGSNTIDLEATP